MTVTRAVPAAQVGWTASRPRARDTDTVTDTGAAPAPVPAPVAVPDPATATGAAPAPVAVPVPPMGVLPGRSRGGLVSVLGGAGCAPGGSQEVQELLHPLQGHG